MYGRIGFSYGRGYLVAMTLKKHGKVLWRRPVDDVSIDDGYDTSRLWLGIVQEEYGT